MATEIPILRSERQPIFVDNDQLLRQESEQMQQQSRLAFDSEFIRTDTFFPKPGLYQLNDGTQTCLIDPLPIRDWSPFKQLLANDASVIVMHSCGEDLGLLRHALECLPARLFDTQHAAAFVGYDYSLSYQALVKEELGIDVPKGETRSDWLRRPLSAAQLEYAALDVKYLLELQQRLTEKLDSLNRLAWFEEDCQAMLLAVNNELDSRNWELAYCSFGTAWQLNEAALEWLQKLAYWREETARKRDKPRNWIAKDPELFTLATRLPEQGSISENDIVQADVFSPRFLSRNLTPLTRFLNLEHAFQQPASTETLRGPLQGKSRILLKKLQKMTRERAEKLTLSPELLARKRLWVELLENYQSGREDLWPAGLDNWRRELLEPGVNRILARPEA